MGPTPNISIVSHGSYDTYNERYDETLALVVSYFVELASSLADGTFRAPQMVDRRELVGKRFAQMWQKHYVDNIYSFARHR